MNLQLTFFFFHVLDFVRCYSEPKGLCIDACSGSMSFSIACLLERRQVIAIDFDAKQRDGAIARLSRTQQDVRKEHNYLVKKSYKQMVEVHDWLKRKDVRHFPVKKIEKKVVELEEADGPTEPSSSSSSSSKPNTSEMEDPDFLRQILSESKKAAVSDMVESSMEAVNPNPQVCSLRCSKYVYSMIMIMLLCTQAAESTQQVVDLATTAENVSLQLASIAVETPPQVDPPVLTTPPRAPESDGIEEEVAASLDLGSQQTLGLSGNLSPEPPRPSSS